MTRPQGEVPAPVAGEALASRRLRLRQSRRRARHLADGVKRLEAVALETCASALATGEVPGCELGELLRTTLMDLTDAAAAPLVGEVDAARAMIATFLGARAPHGALPGLTPRPQLEIPQEIEDLEVVLLPFVRLPVFGRWMTLRIVEDCAGRLVATTFENLAYRLRDWAVREIAALDDLLVQHASNFTPDGTTRVFSREESDERAT